MKQKAYILIFDGLADWEAALALCEINKSGKFDLLTIGLSEKSVTTMGGLRITPDATIGAVRANEAAIFIMPGGEFWEAKANHQIIALLRQLKSADVPIAAICGATLEIARAGLTEGCRHTSNSLAYLKTLAPNYADENFYIDELAVTDGNLITASGLGYVEFGREIIRRLGIYNESDIKVWFDMFKHG